MIRRYFLALSPLPRATACSPGPAPPPQSETTASAPSEAAAAAPARRIATWAGRPAGRLALAHGRLAVIDGCVTLQGDEGPLEIALPRDAASWDSEKSALMLAGTPYRVGQIIAVAGGSIDRARAEADPAFALNDCVGGPLVFVVERVFDR